MSEKKKVAVLLPWMKMGGTNKIALHFMKELAEYCDVTLVLSEKTGELLDQIPQNINVIVDKMTDFKTFFKDDLKHFRCGKLFEDFIYYMKIKLKMDSVDNYRYIVQRNDYICDTEFDCAISYHGQSPERLLNLIYRTKAKKRVVWIHGEFNNTTDHYRRMERYYNHIDHMFFVSKHTMNSFFSKMTLKHDICSVYYNPIDIDEIITKAEKPCNPMFDKNYINIVTVGRISSEKGQDMIPEITSRLLECGYEVMWYVIGDGDSRSVVEDNIRKFGVKKNVILLGTMNNPYPYIKACDIYVQPSYTEGYSTTICEAGILGKTIVGTKPSGGIYEQIADGSDGLIVDANVNGLTYGIRKLIADQELRKTFEHEIQKKNFEGKGEIKKFLELIGM